MRRRQCGGGGGGIGATAVPLATKLDYRERERHMATTTVKVGGNYKVMFSPNLICCATSQGTLS